MKLTTIVLSSVLTLGSTLALAQGASSDDAAAAGGATGGPAGAGSSSAVKSDKMDPSGTGDSAQGSHSDGSSSAIRSDKMDPSGTRDSAQDQVRATRRPLQRVARRADRLGLVLPMQLRATPQARQKAPRPANNEAGLRVSCWMG